MAINKKLIHFQTLDNFEVQLSAGNILDTSICFIKDAKKIWTHGQYYNNDSLLSGKLNVTSLENIVSAQSELKDTNDFKLFIITDSVGSIPSSTSAVTISSEGLKQLSLVSPDSSTNAILKLVTSEITLDPIGVNVGDLIALSIVEVAVRDIVGTSIPGLSETVRIYQYKVLATNDAKPIGHQDVSTGVSGLMSPWDKTQVNKIAGIEATTNAALPKTSLLPSSGIGNMNNALETGIYVWCTLGRPSGATGAFTCVVHRSSTPDFNNFYTIEQTAYGREAELGQVYKRIIFWRSDEQQYGEWVRVDNTGGDVDLSNYLKYSVIDSEHPLEVKVDNLDYVEFKSVGAEDILFKNGFSLTHEEYDLYYDGVKVLTEDNASKIMLSGFELIPYNPNGGTPDRLMYDGNVLFDEYNYKEYLDNAYVTLNTEQTVTGSKTFEGVATFSNTVDVKKQLTADGGEDEDYNPVTAATFKGYYGKLNIKFDSDNWAIIEKQNDNDGNSVLQITSGDEISISSKAIYLRGNEIYANNKAIGTVTGVKINGSTKTPSDGVVDLGSYAQPVVIEDNSGESWILEHNIGRFPFVQIVNGEGEVVQPTSIKHLNLNLTLVEFNEEVYGTAILI